MRISQIQQQITESNKRIADSYIIAEKMRAENDKFRAETAKFAKETRYYPMLTLSIAAGGIIGGIIASIIAKLF